MELKRYAPDVSPKDITFIASKYHIHANTVRKYFAGSVGNNDIAYDILEGIKERIDSRNKVLI